MKVERKRIYVLLSLNGSQRLLPWTVLWEFLWWTEYFQLVQITPELQKDKQPKRINVNTHEHLMYSFSASYLVMVTALSVHAVRSLASLPSTLSCASTIHFLPCSHVRFLHTGHLWRMAFLPSHLVNSCLAFFLEGPYLNPRVPYFPLLLWISPDSPQRYLPL